MKRAVWVFGPSAVGKRTFIERTRRRPGLLAREMGLAGVLRPVLRPPPGQDPERHDRIREEFERPGSTLLLHGQIVDLPEFLRSVLPLADHEALLLHASARVHAKRAKRRGLEPMSREYFLEVFHRQRGQLEGLGVPFTVVDVSGHEPRVAA